MSSSVDERIVQMEFQNEQFEKGVAQTLGSLDKLENQINSLDPKKFNLGTLRFDTVDSPFEKIMDQLEQVNEKFSLTGIAGMEMVRKLTDKVLVFGEKFVKSMAVEPITQGFSKYTAETNAAQAIWAATGKDTEEIYENLGKLQKYADETSYSYASMVQTAQSFINVGTEMDTAVEATKGIANWAAYSGAGIQKAEYAFSALQKSFSRGYLGGAEWITISRSANMATEQFKELALTVADEMGVIKKAEKETGEWFSDLGRDKWLTTKVLTEVLKRYSDETGELGRAAKAMASEAKTWGEAVGAVQDAVSSGWGQTFRLLFGDYDEAKKFWTGIQDMMLEVFTVGIEWRNRILQGWHDTAIPIAEEDGLRMTGYEMFIKSIENVFYGFKNIVTSVKEALLEVFPPITGGKLLTLTRSFMALTGSFKSFSSDTEKIKTGFSNFFRVLKPVVELLKPIGRTVGSIISLLVPAIDIVSSLIAAGLDWIANNEKIQTTFSNILNFLNRFADISRDVAYQMRGLGGTFASVLSDKNLSGKAKAIHFMTQMALNLGGAFRDLVHKYLPGNDRFEGVFKAMTSIGNSFEGLVVRLKNGEELEKGAFWNVIKNYFDLPEDATLLGEVGKLIRKAFDSIKASIMGSVSQFSLLDKITGIFSSITDRLQNGFTGLSEITGSVTDLFNGFRQSAEPVAEVVEAIEEPIAHVTDSMGKLGKRFKPVNDKLKKTKESTEPVKEVLTGVDAALQNLSDHIRGSADTFNLVESFFNALRALFGISILKNIDKFTKIFSNKSVAGSIANFFTGIGNGFSKAGEGVKLWGKAAAGGTFATSLKAIALSVLAIAAALKILSTIPVDTLKTSAIILGVLTVALGGIAFAIGKVKNYDPSKGARAIVAIAASLFIITSGLAKIAKYPVENIGAATVAIVVLMYMFEELAKRLGTLDRVGSVFNSKNATKSVLELMLGLAVSIRLMIGAVNKLGKLDLPQMLQGLLALGLMMGMMYEFLSGISSKKGSLNKDSAMVFVGFAASILLLSWALKSLAKADPAALLIAGGILWILIASLIGAMTALNGIDTKGAAAGMLAMAFSLVVLSIPLLALSALPWRRLLVAAGTLAALMLLMSLALSSEGMFGGKDAAGAGVGILLIAVALATLTPSLIALSLVHWTKLLKGVGILALVMALLLASAGLIGAVPQISAGLAILVGALGAISAVIIGAGLGFMFLATAFMIFAAIAGPGVMAIAAAMNVFLKEIARLAPEMKESVTIILSNLAEGLTDAAGIIASAIWTVIVILLDETIKGLKYAAQVLLEPAWEVLKTIMLFIHNKMGPVTDWGVYELLTFINKLADALDENKELLMVAVQKLVLSLINVALEAIQSFLNVILGWIPGAEAKIDKVFDTAQSWLTGKMEHLDSKLEENEKEMGKNAGGAWGDGYSEGIEKSASTLADKTEALNEQLALKGAKRATEAVEESEPEYDNALLNFFGITGTQTEDIPEELENTAQMSVDGFIKPFTDSANIDQLKIAVSKWSNVVPDTVKDILDTHSPSKVMMQIGKYVSEGLVIGINSEKKTADKSIYSLTSSLNVLVDEAENVGHKLVGVGKKTSSYPFFYENHIDNYMAAKFWNQYIHAYESGMDIFNAKVKNDMIDWFDFYVNGEGAKYYDDVTAFAHQIYDSFLSIMDIWPEIPDVTEEVVITPVFNYDALTSGNQTISEYLLSRMNIPMGLNWNASLLPSYKPEDQVVHYKFDPIIVKGINNQDELVAITEKRIDKMLSGMLRRQMRT